MSVAPSLEWTDVQTLLSAEVSAALAWVDYQNNPDLARSAWGTQCQVNADSTARFDVVSAADYAEPTETIEETAPAFFEESQNRICVARVQCRFEATEGSQGFIDADTARKHLGKRSTLKRLHTAGISILRPPAPTIRAPYPFEGRFVDVGIFELEFSFQTTIADPDAGLIPTQTIEYEGTAGDVTIPKTQITDPG